MRLDAAQWPGGGVADYTHTVVHEILPYLTHAFGASTSPALRAFGGSSFGGIAALCMGMMHPGVFGGLLVESPSLWIDEGRFLREVRKLTRLPQSSSGFPSPIFLIMISVRSSAFHSLNV